MQANHHQRTGREDERGSMLIVALGILALLSILGLTFVKLMTLESIASTNYVDAVRARLIADGGLQQALSQVKMDVTASAFSSVDEDWVYADGNYWLPLEEATHIRPNTPEEAEALTSGVSANQLNDRRASFAGILARTYHDQDGVDQYKIKILDTQTQFNLNTDYEETTVNGVTYDLNYIRFLDALGAALAKRATPGSTIPSGRNPILTARYPRGGTDPYKGGMAIYQFRRSREGGEFMSKTELLEVLESEDDYLLLKDYVTTRSWVDERIVSPASMTSHAKKPWHDAKPIEPRSPINVNLASKEVLAANLAGISGRAIFLFAGDWNTRDQRLAQVDAGTPHAYAAPAGSDIREEREYEDKGVVVYFDPFGIKKDDPDASEPPDITGAYRFAELIWQEVQTRPFRSFAAWEAWLDETLNVGVLDWTDENGEKVFPQHDGSNNPRGLVITDLAGTPLSQTEKTQIVNDPRFERWFYDCVRGLVKANMNPNARLSSWNPDPVVGLPVDKGSLLFKDPRRDDGDPNKDLRMRQTNEWCLAPMGVFEVTALGEVLGSIPESVEKQQDQNQDGLPDRKIYAQAKVRAIIQLFETVTHRTQRDFEQNAGTETYGGHDADRYEIASYPSPRIYWDPRAHGLSGAELANFSKKWESTQAPGNLSPSANYGYLQLQTRTQVGTSLTDSTAVVDLATLNETSPPHFELLLQDRRVELPGDGRNSMLDPLQADTSSQEWNNPQFGQPVNGRVKNRWGYPYLDNAPGQVNFGHIWGGQARMDGDFAWQSLVLTPDGYYNSAMRPSILWYRASDSGERPDNKKEKFLTAAGQDTVLPGGVRHFAGLDPKRRGASNLLVPGIPTNAPADNDPDEGGNLPAVMKGGVSFWWKPDFDLAPRNEQGGYIAASGGMYKQDQRFCGLIGVSHILRNRNAFSDKDGTQGSWCHGTQLFISRNTSGDLRVTRLYYETVGTPPDINSTSQMSPPYAGVEEQPWVADPIGGGFMPITVYWDKCRKDPQYTWPPAEILKVYEDEQVWLKIGSARTDWWLPRTEIQHWRKGEWHHLAFLWDHETGNLRAWLDTDEVTGRLRENQIGDTRYTPVGSYDQNGNPVPPQGWTLGDLPAFVRLNAKGGGDEDEDAKPKDMFSVGSIWRDQDQRAGLFKHARDTQLTANGTIDDVRFWDADGGSQNVRWTGRYEEEGGWANSFDLTPFFPDSKILKLGSIRVTAYLPTEVSAKGMGNGGGIVRDVSKQPQGAGEVTLRFRVDKAVGDDIKPDTWEAVMNSINGPNSETGFQLTNEAGVPVEVGPNDKLIYELELLPARFQNGQGLLPGNGNLNGFPVASPVIDEVAITYFLPNPKLLLKERVNQ